MRKSQLTEEQIAMAPRQHKAGTTVGEICRKLEISDTTFFRWEKQFSGMGVTELRELRQLREENRELEGLVADLSLDKRILQEAPSAKVMTPALRREAVAWVRAAYRVSECRACRVAGAHRSNVRYRSRRYPQTALRTRLKELATTHVSQCVHVLLRREGWPVNRKRVYRLYREGRLMLKPRWPKRHRTAAPRMLHPAPQRLNERWAMDFVHDTLAGARTIRVLTVLDVHTRECVALVPQPSFRGADVARILSAVATARAPPSVISLDNALPSASRVRCDSAAAGARECAASESAGGSSPG
jgi:putative transposase